MTTGGSTRPGDKPTDFDRSRAANRLRANADHGLLSSGELDRRIEHVYRAKTLGEIDILTGDLDPNIRLDPAVVMAMPVPVVQTHQRFSFMQRQVMYSGSLCLLWVVVWVLTGGPAIYLLLGIVLTMVGFTLRIARGETRKTRGSSGVF